MLKVVLGDLTKQTDIDAIVNAANSTLLGGGGVDGAIHRAAGPELLKECETLNGCEPGHAKITKGYNLPCKYVIHTVGPIYYYDSEGAPETLASCYRESLKLAKDYGIRKIAFPSISTGAYGYPVKEAAEIAVRTVKEFLKDNEESFDIIEWVLFDKNTYGVYEKVVKNI